jgi:hypothetical protein
MIIACYIYIFLGEGFTGDKTNIMVGTVIRFHGNRVEVLVSQSETLIFHFITLLNALVCRFKVELTIKLPAESRISK